MLGKLSKVREFDYTSAAGLEYCPDLPPITMVELTYMRKHLNADKAITFDGYSAVWLKSTYRLDIISNFW